MSRSEIEIRTCLGCREEKDKEELVRLVAAPDGAIVIDYKGKLPGRGSYLCPKESCIRDAFLKKQISRAFKDAKVGTDVDFLKHLRDKVLEKISSLISLSRKAGKVVDGREAVMKGIEKGSVRLLLLAEDISSASFKDITDKCRIMGINYNTCLSKDVIGSLIGKGDRGMVGITDDSFSLLIEKELGRVKSLGIPALGGEVNV